MTTSEDTASPSFVGGAARYLGILPGLLAALLPKLACPACWPAYAGILGSLGVTFMIDEALLLPLTVIFLLAAIGALAFRARRRRGYNPFFLGVVAALLIVVGNFALDSEGIMYTGVVGLMIASLWNGWPLKTGASASCSACPNSNNNLTPIG